MWKSFYIAAVLGEREKLICHAAAIYSRTNGARVTPTIFRCVCALLGIARVNVRATL